mgnify:CR=1 FL=1
MNYYIKASSIAHKDAVVHIKQSNILFGTNPTTSETLPNPAELYLSSIAACILKNVERFSGMLKFRYTKAEVSVHAVRLENPPRMDNVTYELTIHSDDKKLNIALLQKNIETHGTIYNTIKLSSSISGKIITVTDV